MQIQNTNNYQTAFQAKFLHSDDLKRVADYAVEHNKFAKLNQARKNIDSAFLLTRLKLNISQNSDGYPVVSFTRYVPKKNVNIAYSMDDFAESKTTSFTASQKMNPLKFALEKIIKLGNGAPKNNMFKTVVKD